MITTIKTNFIFALICLLSIASSYAQLVHPGGWLNATDLSRIREKVASGEEPWASAWNDIKNKSTPRADVSSTMTDGGALQSQGEDAYVLAIKWVVTGDQNFADEGIEIVDTWVNTVDTFNLGTDTPLRIGLGANMMASAAEILAHGFNGGSGWSSTNISNAQTWFKDLVYPLSSTGPRRSLNWGTACVAGNMAMAVFCDDMTMFNDAIDAYKFGFTNTHDGCAGVAQYIVNEAGQCYESGRDQAHAQGGIAHLVEPAMIAWNQGVNLVSYENNRLVAGMEYTAKYNLGNSVSWSSDIYDPCNLNFGWTEGISDDRRGNYSPVYVMANTLFEYAGVDHPYTNEVTELSSYFPEKGNADHPGMGYLLYTGASSSNPTTEPTNPSTEEGNLVHITKRNATGFAIDGGAGGTNGQNVTLSSVNTSDEGQLWLEIDRGNGFYSYEKYGTNYSLDGDFGGATNQSVYLWETNATNQNQQWQKVAVGDGGYKLIKRNATGFAINGGSGGREGQDINLWNSASRNQNLQWYITPIATNTRLEAEDFDSMSGIQTEASSESGDNVGWINDGDWLRFDDVNLSGITNMDARIACNFTGGTVEVRTGSANGTLIGSINVSNTGGNQNWTTLNTSISNASGTQDVYLVFTGGNDYLFNINWVEFNTSSQSNKDIIASAEVTDVIMYPNPVVLTTTIENAANSIITIYDMNSSIILKQSISSDSEILDLSLLSTGIYFAEVKGKATSEIIKLVKN